MNAIEPSIHNSKERVTGAHAVITTDHAFIHDGIAFTQAGTVTVATATTGGLFFTAPAAAAATVTINMSNAAADLTYTATSTGIIGNTYHVEHLDPSGPSESLAVVVSGNHIMIYLATDEGSLITSTAAQVKAAVNAHAEASLLVTCEDEGAGGGVVNAEADTYLTGGCTTVYAHFKAAAVRSTAAITVSLMEDYTADAGDTVAALTGRNRNRISTTAARMAMTGGADITPTNGAGAVTLASAAIGANLPAYKVGGDVSSAEEWVLNPGTSYCLAFANASGGNAIVSYDLFWYEEAGA